MMFIAWTIAVDFQSYGSMENKGFVELVHPLQPQHKIPHSTTFSRKVVPKLYQSMVDSLKAGISADLAA